MLWPANTLQLGTLCSSATYTPITSPVELMEYDRYAVTQAHSCWIHVLHSRMLSRRTRSRARRGRRGKSRGARKRKHTEEEEDMKAGGGGGEEKEEDEGG